MTTKSQQLRKRILAHLDCEQTTSGRQLAEMFGISRTGVWKHIEALRKDGIEIDAIPGSGYRLKNEPFTAARLQSKLHTVSIGQTAIEILNETGSTNRDAMKYAEQGADEGLVIFANRQRSGRGRLGRIWHTLPQSLACSVLLRPKLSPEKIPQLSLLTAVALHDALRHFSSGIRIKWPNDLLVQGAKLAGILTEMRAEPGRVHAVVLGFGINLQPPEKGWPHDITQPATDLQTISSRNISRMEVALACLESLDRWYHRYLKEGFAPVHEAWWQAHAASGQQVRVHDGQHYTSGIASALDQDGALLLKTADGIKRIIAGDLELL